MAGKKEIMRCIAVDMGAGSIRVMLGLAGDGRISYREVHRLDSGTVRRRGHERWDLAGIEGGIREGIRKAAEMAEGEIQSIGVDSWGVDFVLLDKSGGLLDEPVTYRDDRTLGMREKWRELMDEGTTFRRTGINFYPFNTLFQLLSLKGSEPIGRSSGILFIPGYIHTVLSGRAANELTISSTSQMLSVTGKEWDNEILERLGIRRELLGEVVDPGTKLGSLRGPGLPAGIENIAVCGHDTASVVSALPVENPGFAFISAGTWCIVGIESDRPFLGERVMKLGFTNERGYGNSYRVLKNITGLWLVQGLRESMPAGTTYGELDRLAGETGEVVQVIDPEDPGFYHPGEMRGAFDAYFRRTRQKLPGTSGEYLRCAYESICFSFRYHLEVLEKISGRSVEVLHVVGGGSRSDTFNQLIADICRRPVLAGPSEGATLGNILVQALTMGRIPSLEEGRRMIRKSFPVKRYSPAGEPPALAGRFALFTDLKEKSARQIDPQEL